MSKKDRRKHSPEWKMTVLKSHLVDQTPVSEVCEKFNIKPSLFYKWQQELFKQGNAIFQVGKSNKVHEQYQKKIKLLEVKLSQKNEVLAELMQEYITLKKTFGEG